MARVPLRSIEDIENDVEDLSGSVDLDLSELNIIRALANNPRALVAADRYIASLYETLSPPVREVVILAVAREKRSAYEWHQHVDIARRAGVPDGTIRAIGSDDHASLSEADRARVEYVRAQCRGEVTDERHAALAAHHEPDDIVAISRLAAHYAGTADFLAALDVPLEEAFCGWIPRP